MREFNPGKIWPPENNRYNEILNEWDNYPVHELEIGAGVGLHPVVYGQNNPNTLIVAVERTAEKYKKFKNSCIEKNVFPVHADVTPWLWHFQSEKKFNRIWILYPNPEPKNKNQRWVNQPFFKHILNRLSPAGEIIIATNIESYFKEAIESLNKVWNMKVEFEIYNSFPRTHFEKKYLERGEICYNIIARY